jgi:altronate dehydratase
VPNLPEVFTLSIYHFHEIARFPESGDNVAIVTHRVEAGSEIINADGPSFVLSHTLLEGHRFAVQAINIGDAVLSWGLPFGTAVENIGPGDYICNAEILEALRIRHLDFPLPERPNFEDRMVPYHLDETTFTPGDQIPLTDTPLTFMGYPRGTSRGAGTRNYIILISTTSQTAGFVKRLEAHMKDRADRYEHIDGIVAVAHTEGGGLDAPNNRELLLRTLAGFMVHANIGAVLAVDYGTETVTNEMLKAYMIAHDYPLGDVTHHFMTLVDAFDHELNRAAQLVEGWLDTVNKTPRRETSAEHLNIVLQCGGSDAFSGISGNPLSAWVVREIIRSGGSANLAETDELIGAEPYVLQNVRDAETARTFLQMIARFKERTAWHGQTVDANPSGGNKFRGIYNIVLKSIGAARKRNPDVRLDYAIEYGERMTQPGYYFMDSPGNDLESIAGQVASGGNLIFFITGNGSITNFPFVPTIKIVTTTTRYELLSADMDVNAGAYLDGMSMDTLGQQTLDLTRRVASGEQTCGERAGHTQVSIWRNWQQTDGTQLQALLAKTLPKGQPIPLKPEHRSHPSDEYTLRIYESHHQRTIDRVGLILPTSLCSGQIARMAANRLNEKGLAQTYGLSRFVSLVHTEGCGASGGPSEDLYARTMTGYLTHPMTTAALLLEHGCERTHNDFYREQLNQRGVGMDRFGWASVQLDGGIDKVLDRIETWFTDTLAILDQPTIHSRGLERLSLALPMIGPVSDSLAGALIQLLRMVVDSGGTIVIPDQSALLSHPFFQRQLVDKTQIEPTLGYGQSAGPGLHVMDTQTTHWVETLVGLGATGVEVMLAAVTGHPVSGHPMIPVLQIGTHDLPLPYHNDLDLILTPESTTWTAQLMHLICQTAAQTHTPKVVDQGNLDFQITRGLLGVSM